MKKSWVFPISMLITMGCGETEAISDLSGIESSSFTFTANTYADISVDQNTWLRLSAATAIRGWCQQLLPSFQDQAIAMRWLSNSAYRNTVT